MILIAFSHAYRPIQKRRMPVGCASQRTPQTMFLNVGLVHHIKPQTVAQFIPTGYIGVMTGTHGIYIGLLHQQNILQHALFTHHTCRKRIVLVAVHPAEADGFTVDQQQAILHLHLAETHLRAHLLTSHPVAVVQTQIQAIQVRRFGCPLQRILHLHADASRLTRTPLRKPFVHDRCLVIQIENRLRICPSRRDHTTIRIFQTGNHPVTLAPFATKYRQLRINLKRGIGVAVIELRTHRKITDAYIWRVKQRNAAVNTSEAPEILIFQVRAIAILVHLHGNEVFTFVQVTGNVKFAGLHAALTVTNQGSVYPNIKSTHGTIETKERLSAALPVSRTSKFSSVLPHRVAFNKRGVRLLRLAHNPRRINAERITCRNINGCSVTVILPIGRHLKVRPRRIVERQAVEILHPPLRRW